MNDARALIIDAFRAALIAVDPYAAVQRSIARAPDGSITINGQAFGRPEGVDLIAIGKAAAPMMDGALDVLGESVRRGFVITKDGHIDRPLPDFVERREAAHPVLDDRSVAAAEALLEWVRGIPAERLVICLISGGGSALVEALVPGVSLDQFQQMTRVLLRAGADIHQLNTVRSQASLIKGGGLRAAIPANRVVTLALSDVLGNDPSVIASGPTVPLRSTRADARQVADDLKIFDALPLSVRTLLTIDVEREVKSDAKDLIAVIADNGLAVEAAADALAKVGLVVEQDESPRTGEARIVAREWVQALAALPADVAAMVAGGELTVTVTGDGLGGRNTEFALAAAIELDRLGLSGWTVASLATDGQDALTGAAGAIVDGNTVAELRQAGMDPVLALAGNDTSPTLRTIEALLETGPTGTNVNDLYFAVRNG